MRRLTAFVCLTLAALLLSALTLAAGPARAEHLGADYEAGQAAYEAGDYTQAYAEWLPLARKGHKWAQRGVGYMYENGLGVPQIDAEAVRWYRKAADQGHAPAQASLGFMYEQGRGVAQDNADAFRWYRKAAEQGYAFAQNNLGIMYEKGRGVTQDYAEAVRWYRKAAEQGNVRGRANLAALEGRMRDAEKKRTAEATHRGATPAQATSRWDGTYECIDGEGYCENWSGEIRVRNGKLSGTLKWSGLTGSSVFYFKLRGRVDDDGRFERAKMSVTDDYTSYDTVNLKGTMWDALAKGVEVTDGGRLSLGLRFVTSLSDFVGSPSDTVTALPPCPTDRYESEWTDCFGTYTYADLRKYVGEYKDGKFHGQGTLTFPDGGKYVGEFRDGYRNGQGTFTFADSDKYVGEWSDDKRHGQGTYTRTNGNKYVGEWSDDKAHGQGTYTYASGAKYVGEFRDKKYHGQGTFTFANGAKYVGEFRNNYRHGQGTYTYANGLVREGIFENNEFKLAKKISPTTTADKAAERRVAEQKRRAEAERLAEEELQRTLKEIEALRQVEERRERVARKEIERLAEEELQRTLKEIEALRQVEERRERVARKEIEALRLEERRERFAALTRGLVAADVIAAIVNDGVKLRALPERGAEAVKQLRRGRQVQVTGVLPNGWLQITEEGEPVGWVYKTAVAPDALATTAPSATRPTVVAAATEEPRPLEEPQQALALERRIALVIGNGRYSGDTPPLANPPNDARLMTAALETSGFEVIELIDSDQKEMRKAISNFGSRLEKAGEDAVGLFYYAGHGVQVDGRNYLIPIGAEINRVPDVRVEAVSAVSVLENMEFARNRLNFVILDSCRNNPYSRGFRGVTRGLARMNASRGTLVAYATGPGEVALDGTGANSPYTLALTQAMAAPDLLVEQMFKRVRQAVMEQTNDQQVPWETSSLTGDFFFTQTEPATPRQ
jgi:hypothetical protein